LVIMPNGLSALHLNRQYVFKNARLVLDVYATKQ
jgi:hypothetical protein